MALQLTQYFIGGAGLFPGRVDIFHSHQPLPAMGTCIKKTGKGSD
jgi:hypothetical protein